MSKLSERLREIRKERGESGEKAARFLNKHQSTWSAWEIGKIEPSVEDILRICQHYGVSCDWLLGASDVRVTVTNGDNSAVAVGDGSQAHNNIATDPKRIEFLESQLAAANAEKSRLLGVIEALTSTKGK